MERRCWVNLQCRGVLLVWMIVGQGPMALAEGAGGGVFGNFFSHLSFLFSVSHPVLVPGKNRPDVSLCVT